MCLILKVHAAWLLIEKIDDRLQSKGDGDNTWIHMQQVLSNI
jgi:hypothetical protein